jgi:hypothetical protein
MPRVDKFLDMLLVDMFLFQIYKVKTTIYYIVDMRCVHFGSRYAVNGRVSSIDIYSTSTVLNKSLLYSITIRLCNMSLI